MGKFVMANCDVAGIYSDIYTFGINSGIVYIVYIHICSYSYIQKYFRYTFGHIYSAIYMYRNIQRIHAYSEVYMCTYSSEIFRYI